jgi:hypothetical protein
MALMTFASPTETIPDSRGLPLNPCSSVAPSCRPKTNRDGSSFAEVQVQTPLLGLSRVRPSTETSVARPLPGHPKAPLWLEAATPQSSFRPCRSSRLRRFTPRIAPQVCCTLHPVMGFAAFPAWRSETRRPRQHQPFPSSALHTLQSLPLAVSRTSSPRPLPPRGSAVSAVHHARTRSGSPALTAHLKALLQRRVRCRPRALPPARCPMLSWASLPFRVLPSTPKVLGVGPPRIAKTVRRRGPKFSFAPRSDPDSEEFGPGTSRSGQPRTTEAASSVPAARRPSEELRWLTSLLRLT